MNIIKVNNICEKKKYLWTENYKQLINWLIILFQLGTNTIFDGQAVYTPFKHHSYIGEIYIFTYNTIKINKNIKMTLLQ